MRTLYCCQISYFGVIVASKITLFIAKICFRHSSANEMSFRTSVNVYPDGKCVQYTRTLMENVFSPCFSWVHMITLLHLHFNEANQVQSHTIISFACLLPLSMPSHYWLILRGKKCKTVFACTLTENVFSLYVHPQRTWPVCFTRHCSRGLNAIFTARGHCGLNTVYFLFKKSKKNVFGNRQKCHFFCQNGEFAIFFGIFVFLGFFWNSSEGRTGISHMKTKILAPKTWNIHPKQEIDDVLFIDR